MSHFADIGFPIQSEQDFNDLGDRVIRQGQCVPIPGGSYFLLGDPSGAQLYCQADSDINQVGLNPHFSGKSRRRVEIQKIIHYPQSSWHVAIEVWAGEFPFVFDLPDFWMHQEPELRGPVDIQLAAFADRGFEISNSERHFLRRGHSIPLAPQAFVPTGLFATGEDPNVLPEPYALVSGVIKEWELKSNTITGEQFYWFLIDTLCGEADVVADPSSVDQTPKVGGVICGEFWLSGLVKGRTP